MPLLLHVLTEDEPLLDAALRLSIRLHEQGQGPRAMALTRLLLNLSSCSEVTSAQHLRAVRRDLRVALSEAEQLMHLVALGEKP